MPQTTILDAPARGYAGQNAEPGAPCYKQSKVAEGAGIVAGQPVVRGTSNMQAQAIANGDTINASTFLGFALLDTTRPPGGIADEDPVTVMVQGFMYVEVSANVVAGNPVFVGNATAQLGDIDDATGTGLVICPGCYFEESGSSGDLVKISINIRTPLDTDTDT
jgi:hypothetical protein